jgi:hypothetical protein
VSDSHEDPHAFEAIHWLAEDYCGSRNSPLPICRLLDGDAGA